MFKQAFSHFDNNIHLREHLERPTSNMLMTYYTGKFKVLKLYPNFQTRGQKFHSSARNYERNLERTSTLGIITQEVILNITP